MSNSTFKDEYVGTVKYSRAEKYYAAGLWKDE